MVTSLSGYVGNINVGFSVFAQMSYSDSSLPFGNVLSAERIRDIFADSGVLFGYGENDVWNTGLTLWSFIGQVLQDGKQSSCNAAVTNATKYMLEHGMQPLGAGIPLHRPQSRPKIDTNAQAGAKRKSRTKIGLCPRRVNIPSFGAGPPKNQPNAQAPKGKKPKF